MIIAENIVVFGSYELFTYNLQLTTYNITWSDVSLIIISSVVMVKRS